MRILMFTNQYLPVVGGVPRSVARFTSEYRRLGHEVLVVAPESDQGDDDEQDVVRVPAIQNFRGSDFAAVVPIPGYLSESLNDFKPEIVHAHHPFLLGSTAVRVATQRGLPLVYTFHTMYEHYTHYVPGEASRLQDFVVSLSTGYCNLCDLVFAPSESVERILVGRGVETPIRVAPTGVRVKDFQTGDGEDFRRRRGIPEDAFLVGHVGRLAREKNLLFLAESVFEMMVREPRAWFLLVGEGDVAEEIEREARERGLSERYRRERNLQGGDLASAYSAMDVFAFASKSETQGMVLTEAAAAGAILVALDAPGAREVVCDRENGRLVMRESCDEFAEALAWPLGLREDEMEHLARRAREKADEFSMERCARRALDGYEEIRTHTRKDKSSQQGAWERAMAQIKTEWDLLTNTASSVMDAVQPAGADEEDAD